MIIKMRIIKFVKIAIFGLNVSVPISWKDDASSTITSSGVAFSATVHETVPIFPAINGLFTTDAKHMKQQGCCRCLPI